MLLINFGYSLALGEGWQSVPVAAVAGTHRSGSVASARSGGGREAAEGPRLLLQRRERHHHYPRLGLAGRHGSLLRHRHLQRSSAPGG